MVFVTRAHVIFLCAQKWQRNAWFTMRKRSKPRCQFRYLVLPALARQKLRKTSHSCSAANSLSSMWDRTQKASRACWRELTPLPGSVLMNLEPSIRTRPWWASSMLKRRRWWRATKNSVSSWLSTQPIVRRHKLTLNTNLASNTRLRWGCQTANWLLKLGLPRKDSRISPSTLTPLRLCSRSSKKNFRRQPFTTLAWGNWRLLARWQGHT